MKSEQELVYRKEAARLRLILDSTRDIVLLVGINGQILGGNRAAVEAYGYSRDELLELNIEQLRAVATLSDLQLQMQAAYETGILFETTHQRKNGTPLSVEVSAQRAVVDGEEVLISIIRDISGRKKIENELRLAQFSVENAAEATLWIEEDGRIAYANTKACELLDHLEAELIGMSILDVDVSLSRKGWAQHWQKVKLHGAMTFESSQRTRNGRIVPVEITANHVSFEGRELHCAFVRSVESRKMLEEQLRQAQKMEAIGRLAGGVAHDFNNLLMVIISYAELLETDAESIPSARKKIEAILTAANRGAELTGQLLAFGRKQVLQPSVLSLNSTVQQVADMVGRVVGEDVEVKVITHPRLGMVKVDGGQMEQVILNLVVNARDAMPNGGRLTLETANVEFGEDYAKIHTEVGPGTYVMLAVSDNGCGIEAETCRHIFEPFFTTKPKGKGTGLGLSMVHGIVKQSGGSITVSSEVDSGTTFKIYFPVVHMAEEEASSPTAPAFADIRGRGELVLVVEDEPSLREVVTQYLSSGGYWVLSASNYGEALQLARRNRKDLALLLTDVVLFGKSGRDIAEAIKAEVPSIKTLYMSGYTFDTIFKDGIQPATTTFIQKPFARATLLGAIQKLLRIH